MACGVMTHCGCCSPAPACHRSSHWTGKCRGSYSTHTEEKTRAGCPDSSPRIPAIVTQSTSSVKSSLEVTGNIMISYLTLRQNTWSFSRVTSW